MRPRLADIPCSPPRVSAVFALAAMLAACGGAVASAARSCPPTPAPPRASAAGVTATADRASVAPGETITFTVIAQGAISFTAQCTGPLQLLAADSAQLQVYSATSKAGGGSPCGAVTLAPGARAVYAVAWTLDGTLPDGTYTATLLLGDRPGLTLQIPVAPDTATCVH